ncbi:hypothetical protein pdam_00025138, partial [Pocillopora damicornis]
MISATPKHLLSTAKQTDDFHKSFFLIETVQINLGKAKPRDFYKLLIKTHNEDHTGPLRWSQNLSINSDTWSKIFKSLKSICKDTKLVEFQFKLIHRTIVTNRELFRFGIKPDEECLGPRMFTNLFNRSVMKSPEIIISVIRPSDEGRKMEDQTHRKEFLTIFEKDQFPIKGDYKRVFRIHKTSAMAVFGLKRNIKCLVFLLITLNLAKSFVPRFHNTARDPQKRDPVKGPRFRDPVRDPQERDPVLPLVVGDPQVPHSDLHPIVSDPEERDPVKVKTTQENADMESE